KSRVNEFSKGKDTKSYAGGSTGLASKILEKAGNTASKAKSFAKKCPILCLTALAIATVSVAPASAAEVVAQSYPIEALIEASILAVGVVSSLVLLKQEFER
ncbi:MAG: hypothetical protein KAJ75_01550, partial [Alphaproteobacteria bacterium]|nr:hypothetical protein [Alphaproteobacteria bacterium]